MRQAATLFLLAGAGATALGPGNLRLQIALFSHCKSEGESVATCMQHAAFRLPALAVVVQTSDNGKGVTESGSLTLDEGGFTIATVPNLAEPTAVGTTPTSNSSTSTTSSSAPDATRIQVSVAGKEQRTLMWASIAIGVVGAIMCSF